MLSSKEKQLLKTIKFSPIVLVTIISVIFTYFLLSQNRINYENELKDIKEKFIASQKEQVQNEVERVLAFINYEKKDSEKKLNFFLKEKVYQAHDIATAIYHKYKNQKSKKEIIELIKTALREIRFNEGRGYFYMHTMDGINVLHPIKPELENQNIINMQDKRGVFILKKIIEGLKSSNDYISELYWYRPNDLKNEYRKITFNKLFEPYNMIIGTGEYLTDFEDHMKEHIQEYVSTMRYGVNGYVFIFDYDGVQLSHVKKSYINQNRIDLQDANGFYITREIIKVAKQGDGFVKYIGTIKPETGEPAHKTTYVKGFDEFQWAIGTGFYTDEINDALLLKEKQLDKENEEYLTKLILFSLALTAFFLAISMYIAKIIEARFLSYRKKVNSQIQKIREKDNILAQQSKMAAMGEMLANIAHQWRQPLSTISTVATGVKMKQRLNKLDGDILFEYMDNINNSVQHLSQTITDFSDYFNPNKQKAPFYLQNTFDKMFKLIGANLEKSHVVVVKDFKEIEILSLENELLQVLINIANNAISQLSKNKNERILKITTTIEDNNVVISIQDNATGIKKDILPRIFEPYFTTKHKSQGTGLGLYMCQEIVVKHMHGSIEANNSSFTYENKEYFGAEFIITLPLLDNQE